MRKKIEKILSIILVVAVLASFLVVPAYATTEFGYDVRGLWDYVVNCVDDSPFGDAWRYFFQNCDDPTAYEDNYNEYLNANDTPAIDNQGFTYIYPLPVLTVVASDPSISVSAVPAAGRIDYSINAPIGVSSGLVTISYSFAALYSGVYQFQMLLGSSYRNSGTAKTLTVPYTFNETALGIGINTTNYPVSSTGSYAFRYKVTINDLTNTLPVSYRVNDTSFNFGKSVDNNIVHIGDFNLFNETTKKYHSIENDVDIDVFVK